MDVLNIYFLIFVVAIVVGIWFLIWSDARQFLEDYSGAVGVVFAVITGAFVLVQYNNSQQDKRLARTLKYIERIESGPTHVSRQWLDLHWIRNRELIADFKEAKKRKDGREDTLRHLDTYRQSFDETDESLESNIHHVMRLFYFYSDVSKCVELELCDASTACEIFAEDIHEFQILHADFLKKWSEVSFDQNFQTIKKFLNNTCKVG